ncbi:MAG: RagB/SusD family nutrient uptake outer membrane protein [Prevotella sp.]|nr:RagB/SusD family nutrient uptake outer membrane protein [Prevotella sp.]
MKKIYYIFAAGLLAFTSCSDFLDVQSEGAPTTTNYFQTDQDAIDAIDACYARLSQEGVFGREIYWEQAGANEIVWGRTRGYSTLATFNYNGDESPLRDVWNNVYRQTISRANWVVNTLLKKGSLTDIERRSLGEAFFLRGWGHFIIAYRYGTDKLGVPFIRFEDFPNDYDFSIPTQQPTVMENYRLICEDMDKAAEYLPRYETYGDDDLGRAHKAAALALKAKVLAYWACWDASKWDEVIAVVNDLQQNYGRALTPNFNDNFTYDISKWYNSEYCWAIPSNGGYDGVTNGGVEFVGVSLENKGWGKYNGWGQFKPTYDIYAEFLKDGAGNARLKRSILEYGDEFQFFGETRKFFSSSDVEAGFAINKWMDVFAPEDPVAAGLVSSNGDWPTTRTNWPIIRFAELKLFRAEAYIMKGQAEQARTDIDDVRTRSGLAKIDHAPSMADIYHERLCELAFELAVDHLYDLKRWYHSGDATIKALAEKELNSHPQVRHYTNRMDSESDFTVGDYEDYTNQSRYEDGMITFPYPSAELTKANGALKNNDYWK